MPDNLSAIAAPGGAALVHRDFDLFAAEDSAELLGQVPSDREYHRAGGAIAARMTRDVYPSTINWPLFEEAEEKWYRSGDSENSMRQFLVQKPDGYLSSSYRVWEVGRRT